MGPTSVGHSLGKTTELPRSPDDGPRRRAAGADADGGEEPSLPAPAEASRRGLDLDAATFGETLPSLYGATSVLIALAGLTNGREVFEEVKLAIDLARQSRNVVGLVE